MFEHIKSFLRDTLALPSGLILMIVGLVSHILFCLLLRKPLNSAWGLLAPVLLGILIESYEIWIHYRDIGLLAPDNDPLGVILLRHSFDIFKMLMLPSLLVILSKISMHSTN